VGVRKVSEDSETDLQGFSMTLAMVPFAKPHMISYRSFIATMSQPCTVSEMLSLICLNVKRSRDPQHIHFGDNLSRKH